MHDLATFELDDPVESDLVSTWEGLLADAEKATTPEAQNDLLSRWDTARRKLQTWQSLVGLRFQQNTQDADRRARREVADRIGTRMSGLDANLKRLLLGRLPDASLESRAGAQALACWNADAEADHDSLTEDRTKEQARGADWTALTGGAKIEVNGESYTMPGLGPLLSGADRDVREAATRALWAWFEERGETIDAIYDDLVKLRDGMAKKRGLDSFVEMGYLRMQRVDYNRDDVKRFRDAVREHVVPLASELIAARGERIGLAEMHIWDEGQAGPEGNPKPVADAHGLPELGRKVFSALHPDLGAFFDKMVERRAMDLEIRDGKAGGGFCTLLPDAGMPFIFANCSGTHGDVRVLTHETGHAFQMYESQGLDLIDKVFPTYEACEVHSMALEFLTWPEMETFFGDAADSFRRTHLEDALIFLPYGVAVDHFQHEIYDNPQWTPEERRACWLRMEAMYRPHRNNGGIAHLDAGGFWQRQPHILLMPFYYIDYTLAQTCALQFWARSLEDMDGAMEEYVALCRRGGTLPFQALVRSANLVSPFDEGCLENVVAKAREWLATA